MYDIVSQFAQSAEERRLMYDTISQADAINQVAIDFVFSLVTRQMGSMFVQE
jgi:hypothetical protein